MTEQVNRPVPLLPEWGPDRFLNKAKNLVRDEVARENPKSFETVEIYVVWFSKTLQNWKACLSTDIEDGLYYEVTYNGDKQRAYVDVYKKISNREVPDQIEDTL
jgi:hypothetical protein